MICFHSNGSIQTKINICSCENCNSGKFIQYLNEAGIIRMSATYYDSYHSDADDDEDTDDEFEEDVANVDDEQYEIRRSNVDIIQIGNTIALYSPPNSIELLMPGCWIWRSRRKINQ